ncbi:MAG: hypothetical protein MMC23_002517 [Stictis urceolatum]|nr:hypothetical protein [Stictis urceolata]
MAETAPSPVIGLTQPPSDLNIDAGTSYDAMASDTSSGSNRSDGSSRGRTRRLKRPPMSSRKSSGTIIVPRDRSTNSDTAPEEYPPDDARAMSPRRNSEETEAMEEATKKSLRENARQVQLSLREIAESLELVRQSHSHLQRQNEMLQDYIGGLTRSMSRSEGSSKRGKK